MGVGVRRAVRPTLAPAEPRHQEIRPSFRPDLEGLRGVAVALVLLDHFFAWPTGGFIGVDVFFVLSGFLITSLLIREHDRSGHVSFKGFYARRVKRILPAAVLVLVVTSVCVYAIFLGSRVWQSLEDALWSLGFAANWRFVLVGQDSFSADRVVSPFQHYWSLAVVEQFYLAWPVLVLMTLSLAGRWLSVDRRHLVLAVALGTVTGLSFVWALLETSAAPAVAYFSTLSRAWELGAGGLLAVLAAGGPRVIRYPRVLTLAGIVVIVVGAGLIEPSWAFPGPWALAPVLGSLLVIYGGMGVDRGSQSLLLTNAPLRYVGKISFSLYLWHWPVVVLWGAVMPRDSPAYLTGLILLTGILSIGSYHLVEDPVRRSGWLVGTKRRRSDVSRDQLIRRWQGLGILTLALTTVVVVRLALGTAAPAPSIDQASPPPGQSGNLAAEDAPGTVTEGDDLATQVQVALEAHSWPEFSIDLDDLDAAKAPEWAVDSCVDLTESDIERCTYDPEGSKLAVVVGDSIALSWMPGIREALRAEDYATLSLTMGQCPAASTAVESHSQEEGFADQCLAYQDWVAQQVADLDPDLVIASSAENSFERLSSGNSGEAAEAEWSAATVQFLDSLDSGEWPIVVLAPPPEGRNLQECVTRLNAPGDCTSHVGELWQAQSQAEMLAVTETENSADRYVDTSSWFCNADGLCPAFVGDTPVRADGNHLTGAYSAMLGPSLREALLDPSMLQPPDGG